MYSKTSNNPLESLVQKPEVLSKKITIYRMIILILEIIFNVLLIIGNILSHLIEYEEDFFVLGIVSSILFFILILLLSIGAFVVNLLNLLKVRELITLHIFFRFFIFALMVALTLFTVGFMTQRTRETEKYYTIQMTCYGIDIGLNILILILSCLININKKVPKTQAKMDQFLDQPYNSGISGEEGADVGIGVVQTPPAYVAPTQEVYAIPQQQNYQLGVNANLSAQNYPMNQMSDFPPQKIVVSAQINPSPSQNNTTPNYMNNFPTNNNNESRENPVNEICYSSPGGISESTTPPPS